MSRPVSGPSTAEREFVVLLDEEHRPTGSADKAVVHTEDTPLHLAFSSYIFGPDGRVLFTRRALGKTTWPGVWTNSCCGHPAPEESIPDAIRRRARQELGIGLTEITDALPDFRYRAISAEGIVENEFCPVFWARTEDEPAPNPDEVAEYAWADWEGVVALAEGAPWAISPWAVEQIPRLNAVRRG
ncbi:isopentenyl-diphosphate Delta-isomerase [Nocardiopsis sp. NPDC055551]|uniref:isopentenyl-diphosphate Delta-isomerase n=1 Tax=Nocardiopsis sp. NPDC006832 TaxID=3157188 RepID=UPI0033F2D40F